MGLDPVHHRAVTHLQMPPNLAEIEPVGIHADGECPGGRGVAHLFVHRGVARPALGTAIALAAGVGEPVFLLVAFDTTFWTFHESILPAFTTYLATPYHLATDHMF